MAQGNTHKVNRPKQQFNQSQLVKAKKYANSKDILNVVLAADKSYTLKEVDKLISNYMKGKVL